jgi:predicted glycosyl hydrolase (DUF1957 family)
MRPDADNHQNTFCRRKSEQFRTARQACQQADSSTHAANCISGCFGVSWRAGRHWSSECLMVALGKGGVATCSVPSIIGRRA